MAGLVLCSVAAFATASTRTALAETSASGFALQVSPSPLVATVKPGVETTLDLQIRNTNTDAQTLEMGLRSFSIDQNSGEVKLGDTVSPEISSLVTFESPELTLAPGQIVTQRIRVHPSATAGFSYNFAITVSQKEVAKNAKATTISGSVAVFTLITIDKPGAVRSLELQNVAATKRSYEFLPASITVTLKNTGNVNVQPTGTVFIQKHSDDTTPIATVALNSTSGHIVPGATRTFTANWQDGYPAYKTESKDGTTTQKLSWQGADPSKLRFGKYVAKVVAIYDDGERDVPIMAEVHFWVIPWRIIITTLIIVLIIIAGLFVTVRSVWRTTRRATKKLLTKTGTTRHEP